VNFVSLEQFYKDIAAWEPTLPHFDAVCGVPRSGLIPAAYLALRRNVRFVELGSLLHQPEGIIERSGLRESNPVVKLNKPYGNKLLIVDDASSENSITFTDLRSRLANQKSLEISYAAVYRAAPSSRVDYYYREVPHPRMFGWNWWRHTNMKSAVLDMDGVICEDWKSRPEMNEDPEFENHVVNAKPLYIPGWPVLAISTSRIERYRKQTQEWLAKHKVYYEKLIMHPAPTPEARRKMNDHAQRKATTYHKNPHALIFVESDKNQAEKIFKLTQRPVLCVDTMFMFSKEQQLTS
jgi:uncharacterized HAD superfamily protein